ncbi:unnamed protein product [Prunus armeniaca]
MVGGTPSSELRETAISYGCAALVSTEPQTLFAIHIPTKVSKALKDPKWIQAIKEEMKALEKN